jgi:1-acyl-sn-glycerol-3-phosphate acyltransferase
VIDLVAVLPHAVFHTLRISAPTIVEAARGRTDHALYDERLRGWARALVDYVGLEFEVRGAENVPRGESFVVMSNHQSVYDIPVVYLALPMLSIRMVAKAILFRVPVWGRALRISGFVEVDRKDRARAIAALRAARETMASGISVWIAPEGTRSRSGELGDFKQGGFHLALETGARILPVTIDGTRNVLPADTYSVERGVHVNVTIHPPIDPAAYGAERRAELVADVRRAIAAPLAVSASRG